AFDFIDVSCDPSGCSTIGGAPEDDRGFRKKSREKMRRQEVNVKVQRFDELVDLLGLSSRVRKSAILQEAVSAIKGLKRERDDLRRDRDRLQQEVSKLATCLQYSHLGSVAAANASGTKPSPPPKSRRSCALLISRSSCLQGTNCFPMGSAFTNLSSHLGPGASHSAASAASGQITIAPKSLKPSPSSSSYTPIAPDTLMK
ncbi:hypothetical protein BBJ28_00024696, partial [Nothophytophthora sp. Chile5]